MEKNLVVIQKRADELKPGDVLTNPSRDVVLFAICEGSTLRIGTYDTEEQKTSTRYLHNNDMVDVEAPELTHAQQHAEELYAVAERMVRTGNWGCLELSQVVAKIKPPEPPTLAEALEALDALHKKAGRTGDAMKEFDSAWHVLERARCAKLI